ncbi:MAG: hypothetical protein J5I98_17365 [Phaeodactylibacter sp.]|nr:hypothetical protein [Phaeodactylibacter sp.]
MKQLSPDQIFLLNRAGRDEKYLAHSLKTYMQSKGFEWADLAEELNCDEESLLKLALCHRIDTQSSNFIETLQTIANYACIDAFLFANMLKKVAASAIFSIEKNSRILPLKNTYLAAAREKNDTSSEDQT